MTVNAAVRRHLPLIVLLLATAVIYLVGITRNGMANDFYAASVWAGSENWKALLFGSLDPSNSITVDKPPLSIWVMGLSARIFGFSSASMLIPQALMAVASVGLLYGAVRRLAGEPAGLIAGTVLALTPAAALMFRFNNPDAAMVLLMVAGAYCTVRALQGRGGRWLALAGVALGLAFLAKMLEGLLVLPALGLVYLVAAPVDWRRRVLHLLGAAAALVVSAGWFVVLTILWPADSRPYLAGSTDNSFMDLVLGYNGFGRVLGQNHKGGGGGGFAGIPQDCLTALQDRFGGGHGGPGGHGGGHAAFGQQPGLMRLFTGEWGLEISFLLPAALVALVVVLWLRRGEPRTDLVRAGAILFGAWTVVDGLLLAEMKQAAHPYYSLSVAPGIAGLVGIGLWTAWQRRGDRSGLVALVLQIVAGGGWAFALLCQNDGAALRARWVVLGATVLALGAVWVTRRDNGPRWREAITWCLIAVSMLLGPAVYVWSGIAHPQTGGSPMVSTSGEHWGGGRGGASSSQLTALLQGTDTTWAAATNGSSSAASMELASRRPVLAVGGFTGSDPSPTLARFQSDVQQGRIRYYIASSQGRGGPGAILADLPEQCRDLDLGGKGGTTGSIAAWVQQNYAAQKVGSATVYDLTKPVGRSAGR
ncbi:glycosyltransferase family 39 protein [Tsukamurella sp. NPDC003166]|uniref:ArnT family glycosyltransferase n=1 Tax=Tsukamurella sp. NPDC003166 TaxID=3154444 RepID=UPI0033B87DD8